MFLNNEAIKRTVMHLLDKADDIPFCERKRETYVSIDKTDFPEIFFPQSYGEDVILEKAINKLCQEGVFELTCPVRRKHLPLVERRARLYFNVSWEEAMRVFYSRPIKKNEWEESVFDYPFKSLTAQQLLSFRPLFIQGKSHFDVIKKFDEWAIQSSHKGTSRQESSKCFWGLSKVFDNREDIVDAFNLKAPLVMLNVYSFSKKITQVLFIENLDTFNAAIESDNPVFSGMAIIYSSGYKASAKRIRRRSGSRMFFEQSCAFSSEGKDEFLSWFYQESTDELESFFWGDLDYSGIGILVSLKDRFPFISAWKPGYSPAVKLQEEGNAHTPKMAKKEGQCKVSSSDCDYADNILIKALDKFKTFVDQESVDIEKIS